VKIFYDYQVFYSQEYGGISRYFCELATRFSEVDNFTVKIVSGIYVNEYLKKCPSSLLLGFHIPPIANTWRMRLWVNRYLCQLWLNSHQPDIIHETYFYPTKWQSHKSKTVITVHDMLHEKYRDILPKSDEVCSAKFKAIKRADHIICVSENTKKDLIELLDVDPSKVSVVYHGNSLKIFENLTKPQHHIISNYILYVGQRFYYKNFSRFVQAYANSKIKHDFKIICFGGGLFSKEERDLMIKLGLSEDQVSQISGDDKALADLYSNAAAFVYPSLYEGFGIPLLEAMSLGCPVICSNTSSLPEVAGKAAEFFDPYEPDSMTVALENVLCSSEKAKRLVNLGYERVKNFSWDKCAEETRLIYLSLL
jgi:glycosyltransferase involved in cell wall biosynthesis